MLCLQQAMVYVARWFFFLFYPFHVFFNLKFKCFLISVKPIPCFQFSCGNKLWISLSAGEIMKSLWNRRRIITNKRNNIPPFWLYHKILYTHVFDADLYRQKFIHVRSIMIIIKHSSPNKIKNPVYVCRRSEKVLSNENKWHCIESWRCEWRKICDDIERQDRTLNIVSREYFLIKMGKSFSIFEAEEAFRNCFPADIPIKSQMENEWWWSGYLWWWVQSTRISQLLIFMLCVQ
jgi:hypothetical protein